MPDQCPDFRLYEMRTGIPAMRLEYDWNMGNIVNHIFADQYLKSHLMLFGGTMLCRVYNICNRTSTDLDFAYSIDMDKVSRHKVRETERSMAYTMMTDHIAPILPAQYKCTFDDAAPTMINVSYTSVIDNAPHSMDLDFKSGFWEPSRDSKPFQSPIPVNTLPHSTVRTVSLKQMFWIKLAVLHCYHNLPAGKGIYPTSSRHYYDIFCLVRNGVPLQDKRGKLLRNVVNTNLMPLQKRRWARYEDMPHQVNLMPAPHIMDALRRDYAEYAESKIYGPHPTWPQIMHTINKLQQTL